MAMNGTSTASRQHQRVKCSPWFGTASSMTGGNRSMTTTEVYNGGAKTPDLINARPKWDDIVLTRPYSPYSMSASAQAMWKTMESKAYTIVVQDLTPAGAVVGKKRTYKCRLKGVEYPGYDENTDAEPAFLQCTFAVQSCT